GRAGRRRRRVRAADRSRFAGNDVQGADSHRHTGLLARRLGSGDRHDRGRRLRPRSLAHARPAARRRRRRGDAPARGPRAQGAPRGRALKALRKLSAADEELALVDVEAPAAAPGWAVLDVVYAGICGTDVHIAHNTFPSWPPVTIGHEFVGRVAAI